MVDLVDVNVGQVGGDGTGDPFRDAMRKLNQNNLTLRGAFQSLQARLAAIEAAIEGGGGGPGPGPEPVAKLRDLATARGIKFGMALDSSDLTDEATAAFVAEQCDIIVPQNALKPREIWTASGTFNWTAIDAMMGWAKANGKGVRGHLLVGHKGYNATWLNSAINAGNWRSLMETWVSAVAGRAVPGGGTYKDLFTTIDVANEFIHFDPSRGIRAGTDYSGPTDLGNPWYVAAQASDGDGLVCLDYAFELAREYFPNAKLAYCNGITEAGNWAAATRVLVLQLLHRLASQGLIDVFASQWHFNLYDDGLRYNAGAHRAFLNEVTAMGIEVQATEFDLYDLRTVKEDAGAWAAAGTIAGQSFTQLLELNNTTEIVTFEARRRPDVTVLANVYPVFAENYTEAAPAAALRTALVEVIGSMKNLYRVDDNLIFVRSPTVFGKAWGFGIIRNEGVNDAGPDHQPWRKYRTPILANVASNPVATGLSYMIASPGSQSLAITPQGQPFGGDYHGGETVIAEQWFHWSGGAWQPFNPLASLPASRGYRIERTSLITWPNGSTATITYALEFVEDDTFRNEIEVASTATFNGNFSFLPMAMVQNGFTTLRYEHAGAPVEVTVVNAEYDLPTTVRKARVTDPFTRYGAEIEFTTNRAPQRLYLLNNENFTKLYPRPLTGFGSLDGLKVTQKVRYFQDYLFLPDVPFVSMTDTFDAARVGQPWSPEGWAKTNPTSALGSATSTISGGVWAVRATNDTDLHRWVRPIADSATGVPLVGDGVTAWEFDLDVTTVGGTGCQVYIVAEPTGSTVGALAGPFDINGSGHIKGNFTPPDGSTPALLIALSGISGRGFDLRELTIAEYVAPPPFASMVDTFDTAKSGEAWTPEGWTKTHPSSAQGSIDSTLVSGLWRVRATDTETVRFTRPITDSVGGGQLVGDGVTPCTIDLDITTYGGTGALLYIVPTGSGSTGSPILGPMNLNQPDEEGHITETFTPGVGVTPFVLIVPSAIAGRGFDLRTLTVTKT